MLNRYYQGIWKHLPDRYNKMHVCDRPYQGCNVFDGDTIAIHEKIFALRKCCYQSSWIWNQLNSSYDIHNQANDSMNNNNVNNKSHTVVVRTHHHLQQQGIPKPSPQRKPNPNSKKNLMLKPMPDRIVWIKSNQIESNQHDRYWMHLIRIGGDTTIIIGKSLDGDNDNKPRFGDVVVPHSV